MSASLQTSPDGQFALKGVLDFESVPVLWRQHKHLLEIARDVCIDLSAVEHSNSAGIALLMDWQRHARKQNISLTWRGMPAQMQSLARVSGVMDLLSLVEPQPAD